MLSWHDEVSEIRLQLSGILVERSRLLGMTLPPALADSIVKQVVLIAPQGAPEEDSNTISCVTLRDGGSGGGRSKKIANLLLDLRRTGLGGVEMGLLVSQVGAPWMLCAAALMIIAKTLELVTVPIDEDAASVLWAAWQSADERGRSPKRGLHESTNLARNLNGRSALSESQYTDAVTRLVDLRVLHHDTFDSQVWLVEQVIIEH